MKCGVLGSLGIHASEGTIRIAFTVRAGQSMSASLLADTADIHLSTPDSQRQARVASSMPGIICGVFYRAPASLLTFRAEVETSLNRPPADCEACWKLQSPLPLWPHETVRIASCDQP